jgi:putative membrane protein
MLYYLVNWLLTACAIFVTSKIVSDFVVNGFFAAFVAAIVLGAAHFLLWWVFFVLTLPLNIVTLGLFTFVLNGAILKIAAGFVPGFEVKTWWAAIVGAFLVSLINMVLSKVFYAV